MEDRPLRRSTAAFPGSGRHLHGSPSMPALLLMLVAAAANDRAAQLGTVACVVMGLVDRDPDMH